MSIYDFVTREEIDEAPDGPEGFLYLVERGQRRLNERTSQRSDDDWNFVRDDRNSFQNFVVAIAKAYDIQELKDHVLAPTDRYDDNQTAEFSANLNHYVTQMVIHKARSRRREAISISEDLKGRIRTHIHHLKSEIDKLEISDGHKIALHKKIREFEEILEKQHVNMLALARILFEIMSVTANGVALYESKTIKGLVTNLVTTIAEAKSIDDQHRPLPFSNDPPPLLPPRRQERPKPKPHESFSADLDDEIPF